MTTSASPKKIARPASAKRASVRKRAVRTKAATADEAHSSSATDAAESGLGRRHRSSQSEQLIILVGALAFGLIGLAVHFLWIISILLMAILLGLIASEVRGRHGRGLVAEIVNEAKVAVDEIKAPASRDVDDHEDPTSSAISS